MHECHLESIFLDDLYVGDSKFVPVVISYAFFPVDWKFFGGPTYLVLVESMKTKIEQSQFTSGMQCRMTGDHVEITGTSSGVQQKAKTPVEKDVHRGRYEVPAESIRDVGFCRNPAKPTLYSYFNGFERFRNLPTTNVESDSMSGLGVGKRFLSDMVSLCMPADRFESFSAVAKSISIKRNAMTCVAPSEEHAAEVSL
ncbi:hypothetical protein Tco_0291887 [Tanacetum coccineum]